mgnify:CR=1 FL=1
MTNSQLRDLYDQQLRERVEVADADQIQRVGPLWLGAYHDRGRGFITYKTIPRGSDLESLVSTALGLLAIDPEISEVEWKLREHDDLPGLLEVLSRHHFTLEKPETVMIGSLESAIAADSGISPGYRLEPAATPALIREAEEQAGRVFNHSADRIERTVTELVARQASSPESFEMWLVRGPEGDVVCSGRIDFAADTDFASVWGGSCNKEHRGRGLYRALTAERARSALERGKTYLHSDCTAFSRPILERAGLTAVAVTTPAIWRRA